MCVFYRLKYIHLHKIHCQRAAVAITVRFQRLRHLRCRSEWDIGGVLFCFVLYTADSGKGSSAALLWPWPPTSLDHIREGGHVGIGPSIDRPEVILNKLGHDGSRHRKPAWKVQKWQSNLGFRSRDPPWLSFLRMIPWWTLCPIQLPVLWPAVTYLIRNGHSDKHKEWL